MKINTVRHTLSAFLGGVIVAAITVFPSVSANAQVEVRSSLMSTALRLNPGGTVVSDHEVVWADGTRFIIANAQAASAATGCPSGKYCVFSAVGQSGNRYEYSACPATQSAVSFLVRSVANSRSSGTVRAKNGNTTVATLTPGTAVNISPAYVTLTCS